MERKRYGALSHLEKIIVSKLNLEFSKFDYIYIFNIAGELSGFVFKPEYEV